MNPRPPHPFRKRLCAAILRHATAPHERAIAPHRRTLLASLRGHVVEIGPGTGVNLPHITTAAAGPLAYTAVEPNPHLHPDLHARARSLGAPITILPTPIGPGTVPLPDACADAVVCTLVLCSVPDPAAALAEIARLLRPAAPLLLIEHVAAPNHTLLRTAQRAIKPLWRIPGDGCEPDRDTESTLRASPSLAIDTITHFRVPLPIISPHIAARLVRT